MTIYTAVDPHLLRRAHADVNQLTRPIHVAIRRRIITHPPLLDQLRAAATPGRQQHGPERRQVPQSKPPVVIDAVDAHTTILVELSGWHARLRLPSPPAGQDWQKITMRQLVDRLETLAPAIADWAARDIAEWWRLAAVHSGWRTADLLRLR